MNSIKGMKEGRGVHRLTGENTVVGRKWGCVEREYWKFREGERISRHGQRSTLTIAAQRPRGLKKF